MEAVLTGFVEIGPRTSLFTPSQPTPRQLIIVCTWLGASRKHIAKYTNIYKSLAPKTRILLIESNVPILISSYDKQRAQILPGARALLSVLDECRNKPDLVTSSSAALSRSSDEKAYQTVGTPRLATIGNPTDSNFLLHAFSNGGTNTATQLLLVLREHYRSPLPITSLVFDSCPAKGTYWRSYNAMVLSLPKKTQWIVKGAVVHFILFVLYAWIALGNENPASLQRRTLLDEDIISETPKQRRAYYLYSKTDQMCMWTDVSEHAQDARVKGWEVEEIVFENSAHCAHLSKEPAVYIKALTDVWHGPAEKQRSVKIAKL